MLCFSIQALVATPPWGSRLLRSLQAPLALLSAMQTWCAQCVDYLAKCALERYIFPEVYESHLAAHAIGSDILHKGLPKWDL